MYCSLTVFEELYFGIEGAPEMLNEHSSMSAYDKLYDSIKFESVLTACMMDYRAYLYFPESLSVLSADFYKSSAGYPTVISEVSCQVRAGDFDFFTRSELYVIFNPETLEIIGECTSLDPDYYNHAVTDDLALREFQRDACNAINECQNSSQKIEVKVDRLRVNNILGDCENNPPKIDVSRFSE